MERANKHDAICTLLFCFCWDNFLNIIFLASFKRRLLFGKWCLIKTKTGTYKQHCDFWWDHTDPSVAHSSKSLSSFLCVNKEVIWGWTMNMLSFAQEVKFTWSNNKKPEEMEHGYDENIPITYIKEANQVWIIFSSLSFIRHLRKTILPVKIISSWIMICFTTFLVFIERLNFHLGHCFAPFIL